MEKMDLNLDCFDIQDNYRANDPYESRIIFGERKKDVLLTICIPTYKRLDLLKETITSAINQKTDYPYEIIVVDNDEEMDNEKIEKIREAFPEGSFTYYKNMHPLVNWNRCMELANSKWLLLLHDDDMIESNFVQEMLDVVEKSDENWDAICCLQTTMDENGKITGSYDKPSGRIYRVHPIEWYLDGPIGIGFLIKTTCALKVGGYDPRWKAVADQVFRMNCARCFRVARYNRFLCRYRVSESCSSSRDCVMVLATQGMCILGNSIKSHYRLIPSWYHRLRNVQYIYNLELACHNNWNTSLVAFDKMHEFLHLKKGPLGKYKMLLFRIGRKSLYIWIKVYHLIYNFF